MREDVYLQVDEMAAARFAQTIASALEGAIVNALASASPPGLHQLAAMAMQGIISACGDGGDVTYSEEIVARSAYRMAAAMLAERERRLTPSPTPETTR